MFTKDRKWQEVMTCASHTEQRGVRSLDTYVPFHEGKGELNYVCERRNEY